MPGLWGGPLMERFYPTSHQSHRQWTTTIFPAGPAGCHNAERCVSSQGSRLDAPNPAASPCPAPPQCFPQKWVQPGVYSCRMMSFLLAGGGQDREQEPLPLPAAPKPCFAPGQAWVLRLGLGQRGLLFVLGRLLWNPHIGSWDSGAMLMRISRFSCYSSWVQFGAVRWECFPFSSGASFKTLSSYCFCVNKSPFNFLLFFFFLSVV